VADLSDKDAIIRAVNGVSYIVHVANPLPGTSNISADEMIRPAKEGMQTIIDAAV